MWPSRGYLKPIVECRQRIISYQVEIKRVAAPYGSCINNWTDIGINEATPTVTTPEKTSHMLPYTQGVGMKKIFFTKSFFSQLCLRNCFFGAFAKEAGCAHPELFDLETQMTAWNVSRPCNLEISGITHR